MMTLKNWHFKQSIDLTGSKITRKASTMMIHVLTGYISIVAPSQGDISVDTKGV